MANPTLTVANAVITLTIPGVYDTPQQLQGFSADNIYDVDQIDSVETLFGVDGKLSGGFVFNPVNQTFTLQADSASCDLFDTWRNAQAAAIEAFACNGQTTLKGLGKTFTMTNGYLVAASPLPRAARIAQPRQFTIRWQRVQGAPS